MKRLHKQGFSGVGEDVKKRLRLLSEERLTPREEKTCVFVRHFLGKKNGGWKFLSSSTILNRFLRRKTQNFAVKSNSENRFTFVQKNSEYLELMELGGKVLSLRNLIFSPHLLDLLAKQCAWEDIHLYLYEVFFR